MTILRYIPSSDSDKVVWLNNFSTKISNYASAVGLTAAEVTGIKNDAAAFQYVVNLQDAVNQTGQNITGYRSQLKHAKGQQHIGAFPVFPQLGTAPAVVPEGVFDRIAKFVARIKSSVNYTDAIGQDLNIIAPVQTIDVNALQPVLKIKLDAGRPHIKCVKGIADGLDLYADRHDGAGFVLIGRLIVLDYIDTTNLPANTVMAQWDYKAIYVIGNDNVGLMSSVETVTVKKM